MTTKPTVIENARRIPLRATMEPQQRALLAGLKQKAKGCDAHGILELALTGEMLGKTGVVSSFGAESAVLLHLVAQTDSNTPVLFVNTAKLFDETLRYRDRLQDALGLGDVRTIAPSLRDRALNDPEGALWSRDADACCHFRKTVPLARALAPFAAQVTGLKRFQTKKRANIGPVEFHDGRFRFNPLWQWDQADLEAYVETHNLPRHPLVEDGYPSIGCMTCTRRIQAGEDYHAGRWAGLEKVECGIHGIDGDGI